MKRFTLVFILLTCSALATEDGSLRIYYGSNLVMYPADKFEPDRLMVKSVFNGHSESDLLSLIQKKYFYYIPRIKGKTTNFTNGMFKVTIDTRRRIKVYERPGTGLKVVVHFGRNKLSARKYVLYNNRKVDSVRYHYNGRKIIYAESELYGRMYFVPADNFMESFLRSVRKWWDRTF